MWMSPSSRSFSMFYRLLWICCRCISHGMYYITTLWRSFAQKLKITHAISVFFMFVRCQKVRQFGARTKRTIPKIAVSARAQHSRRMYPYPGRWPLSHVLTIPVARLWRVAYSKAVTGTIRSIRWTWITCYLNLVSSYVNLIFETQHVFHCHWGPYSITICLNDHTSS